MRPGLARSLQLGATQNPQRPAATKAIAAVDPHRRRHSRTPPTHRAAQGHPPEAPQRFERGSPNELWQIDFKGAVEVDRRKLMPFTVLDDHSRYLLAFKPCTNVTMASAWNVLWDVFAEVGLPDQILCDNAFNTGPCHRSVSSRRRGHGRTCSSLTSPLVELFEGDRDLVRSRANAQEIARSRQIRRCLPTRVVAPLK